MNVKPQAWSTKIGFASMQFRSVKHADHAIGNAYIRDAAVCVVLEIQLYFILVETQQHCTCNQSRIRHLTTILMETLISNTERLVCELDKEK
jgi:hypothetical protein